MPTARARAAAHAVPLPIGRFVRPDEIAALVACLLAPAATAITGHGLPICGSTSLPR